MANTTIKITQLPNIGSNLAANTLLPVVDTNGVAITEKVSVGNLANFILTEAGNLLPEAFVSLVSYDVVNAAQPNITSVGNLSGLRITNLSNFSLPGGVNGYVLQTNGAGNLSWTAQAGAGNGNPGGSNTQIQFNDSGLFGGSTSLTFDKDTATLGTVNLLASSATIYDNLAASNINATGNVIVENVEANNFTTNNFTSTSNISAPYFIGDGSQLTGVTATAVASGLNTAIQYNDSGLFAGDANLTWDSANSTLNTANIQANEIVGNVNGTSLTGINIFGTYFHGDGSNITNIGNASYANTANTANTASVANSVAVANVVGIGNIAVISLSGSSSNVLYGNGVFAAIPSSYDDSNVVSLLAAFGSNTISTTGDITVGNIIASAVASPAPSINGFSSITSEHFYGNIETPNQSNITSLGNLLNVQLDTTVTPIVANVGQMFWDSVEQTVTLGMNNGVQQQVGLETYILVKASAPITNGQVVMFTGASGDNVEAAPADVTVPGFKTEYIIGVATQNLNTNDFGYITTFGKVHNVNTNSFNLGDILWLSTNTPGAMTNVQPTDPNFQIQIAAVTKKSGGDGHIQVRPTPYWSLSKLTDVNLTSPSVGESLVYGAGNVWINGVPNVANIAYSVSGSNVTGTVANASHANVADSANSVAGSNVSGQVSYAAVANSVAAANVSGLGNVALINRDGNASNVLYGNGVFAAVPVSYGNSNVATFLASFGSNSISTTGNITAGNISGNISITGNVIGTSPNVSLVAGSYTYTFDNTGVATFPAGTGNEGGEIQLEQSPNSTLSGNTVVIDNYADQIRIFENGGSSRGVYIDLTQASANVGTMLNNHVGAVVNAGVFVTMDNLKATVTTSGNRSLALASVSGSFSVYVSGVYTAFAGGTGGTGSTYTVTTTTGNTPAIAWNFNAQGDTVIYVVNDITNNRCYRITMMIGGSYLNNMISIERLL